MITRVKGVSVAEHAAIVPSWLTEVKALPEKFDEENSKAYNFA